MLFGGKFEQQSIHIVEMINQLAAGNYSLPTEPPADDAAGRIRRALGGLAERLAKQDAEFKGLINDTTDYAQKLAQGVVPNRMSAGGGGPLTGLRVNLTAIADNVAGVAAQASEMAAKHIAGDIDARIPADRFVGVYRDLSRTVNDMVADHINTKLEVVDCVTRYVNGDFTPEMTKMPGRRALITSAVVSVKSSLQKATAERSENLRLRVALDNVSTNVMVADNDRNIVYLNKTIQQMLADAESAIRKSLPNFSAANLQGTNIDGFHKNPSHQRNLLANLHGTHRTSIELGGRSFNLIVNPVIDAQGQRLGNVVEWADTTDEKARVAREAKLAADNARIKVALDNVTTNVMLADNDRTIIYMNKSVSDMMLRAESDIRRALPHFDARKLIGTSMDGFHRNPAHQRDLLANLRNTYKAQISVGGRTFRLIANPVVDDKGERLGSVVEWSDRTEEVAVEKEVGSLVAAAANGDFSQRIVLDGKDGFFRQLGEGINQLMSTSAVGLAEVARVLGALANGDLRERITNDYHGMFGQLKDDSNTTSERLTDIVQQIKDATDAIDMAAKEIATGNTDLSQRTEEQASSLEETASSMEELTATVRQNAENAKQANQLAISASDIATKGGGVVARVVETMASINESSKKIVDIISVIDGIAFQTNILALNAAVEAARAGEQGRGFAVVATEVRNLAQRSAAAAKEIKSLIGASVETVQSGSRLVDEAGKTMGEIVVSVKRVTDLMSEISSASLEQSSGIEQVNKAITQMDEVTQQNAALVEQAAAAAESLEDQARSLATAVSVFKIAGQGRALARAESSSRAPAVRRNTSPSASAVVPRSRPPKIGEDDEWEEF